MQAVGLTRSLQCTKNGVFCRKRYLVWLKINMKSLKFHNCLWQALPDTITQTVLVTGKSTAAACSKKWNKETRWQGGEAVLGQALIHTV